MIRDQSREIRIDFLRAVDVVVAREEAGVGVGEPQRVLVALVGELQPALRLDRIAERVGDQAGVIIAEHLDAGIARCGRAYRGRGLQIARAGIGSRPSAASSSRRAPCPASPAGRVARARRRYWPSAMARVASARRARRCRDRGAISRSARAKAFCASPSASAEAKARSIRSTLRGSARRASRKYSAAASVSRSALGDQRGEVIAGLRLPDSTRPESVAARAGDAAARAR